MHYQNASVNKQSGITLVGLIMSLVVLGLIAVLAMKVAPTVIEFQAIKKAIVSAKSAGSSVREIQIAFEKQADVGYIESIKARDLIITRTSDGFDVAFEYEKRIPLFTSVSLVIDYSGTTAKNGVIAKGQ